MNDIEFILGGLYKYSVELRRREDGPCSVCNERVPVLEIEMGSGEYGASICLRCISVIVQGPGFCREGGGAFCLLTKGHEGEHVPRARSRGGS